MSKLDHHSIPRLEDLLATLSKGRYFTTLNLSQVYLQLPLDEQSKKYVVTNTHKGLFRYIRLPCSIFPAPGVFQRGMETLLQGLSGVAVCLDDILIAEATNVEHLAVLEEVLHCTLT